MNDFLEPLESLKRQSSTLANTRRSLTRTRDNLKRSLTDHRRFDPQQCTAEVSQLHLVKAQVSEALALAEATLRVHSAQLQKLTSEKVSLLKIVTYFSAEQKLLRSQVATLERRLSELQMNKVRLEGDLQSAITKIEQRIREIAEFKAFDAAETEDKLRQISAEIDSTSDKISKIDADISRINQKIGLLITEYEGLQVRFTALNATILEVASLDDDLNNAGNGYERAQIHTACEARFGHGSPKKVRNDASKEIRSIENTLPKLERRIRDELNKCKMTVSHIIIDGNNTCYDRSKFIRMHALTRLVDELVKSYRVTVVFDASIRNLMKTHDDGIERIIGRSAAVHVAPTRTGADEYILRIADGRPDYYILSNDRFSEFSEYEAVKSGRLLRFLIANNQIMLNDLDISIAFRTFA